MTYHFLSSISIYNILQILYEFSHYFAIALFTGVFSSARCVHFLQFRFRLLNVVGWQSAWSRLQKLSCMYTYIPTYVCIYVNMQEYSVKSEACHSRRQLRAMALHAFACTKTSFFSSSFSTKAAKGVALHCCAAVYYHRNKLQKFFSRLYVQ